MFKKIYQIIFGKPRDLDDPGVFHHISLIPLLAWVGLGADGLSSSTYGPEETFRMLGSHAHLSVFLAIAMIITIAVISYTYSKIIEHFPFGGGGYVIATSILGPKAGVVSGSALLVDYILTISVSIAAATDALFSFLPLDFHPYKIYVGFFAILGLSILNLRGVKESILLMLPIFLVFLITHAAMIGGAIFSNIGVFPEVARGIQGGVANDLETIGIFGIMAICLRAYSIGCGTYTGIEAVSNGLSIMREPKVLNGKKTMLYMAVSLALTSSGLILAYLLFQVIPAEGKTMNAVLAERFMAHLFNGEFFGTQLFIIVTLVAEAALLLVAAQAGFIDGPRVMANMAQDSWLPHRLAKLSERLTIQDGIIFMSLASAATLLYAHGHTATLVVMYSINVFLTFTLSELSMVRFWWQRRHGDASWRKKILVFVVGLVLCFAILVVNLYEKFFEGGWVTIAITTFIIAQCAWIRWHYNKVRHNLSRLDEVLESIPKERLMDPPELKAQSNTAVIMVGGHMGLGVHSLYTVLRLFPNYYKNFIFVSVGVVDSEAFKQEEIITEVRQKTESLLKKYVDAAHNLGLASESFYRLGTDVLAESEAVCKTVAEKYPRAFVFCGRLIFQKETMLHRFLHNDTAYGLQKRLQFAGLNCMVLPVRVMTGDSLQKTASKSVV